jgi:hypothetical protein
MYKLAKAIAEEYRIASRLERLKSIDLSRLKVTALDNSINKIEYINI